MKDDSVPLVAPATRNARRVLRVVGWNLLFILVGLLLVGSVGEVYFRVSMPFAYGFQSVQFVDDVGVLYEPNSSIGKTNLLDLWTISQSNSLGFPDREPIDSAHAAEGCHITVIGDSFVAGVGVPLSDRLQVSLEEIALSAAPDLDVTTSAFGFSGTAQANQLAFYDEYARGLFPKLIVLVFVENDLYGNFGKGLAALRRWDADHQPYNYAYRAMDGTVELGAADPDWHLHRPAISHMRRGVDFLLSKSYFATWVHKNGAYRFIDRMFPLNPVVLPSDPNISDYTVFALRQFKQRADRDGASLVLLADFSSESTYNILPDIYQVVSEIATPMNIPIVSVSDHVFRNRYDVQDMRLSSDVHWSSLGHLWAAEALFEFLKANRDICAGVKIDFNHRELLRNRKDWDRKVKAGRAVISSVFDIYLDGNELTYAKEPCSHADTDAPFFLHITPTDATRFAMEGGRYFDNRDFFFSTQGARFDDKCMANVVLPEYEIDYIRTGQFINGADSEDVEIWNVGYNFALPRIMESLQEIQQSGQEPVIHSNFDIYLDDSRMIYVKDSCDADDRNTPFYLHVFPTDENNLPNDREESGFDNLDFELMQKGGESDGACFAVVVLPEYDIANVRTGQFVRGEGEVWEASIEFAE